MLPRMRSGALLCGMILFMMRTFGQGYCETVRELDGGSCISPDTLRFTLTEDYVVPTSQLLDYTIYDGQRNAIAGTPAFTVAQGRNDYELIYTDVSGLQNGSFYVLEARLNHGERRYLRFQVSTNSSQAQLGPVGTGTQSGP